MTRISEIEERLAEALALTGRLGNRPRTLSADMRYLIDRVKELEKTGGEMARSIRQSRDEHCMPIGYGMSDAVDSWDALREKKSQ